MKKRKVLYRGKIFTVERDAQSGHEIINCSNSVGVLIYIPETDQVLLISQRRPAIVSVSNPTGMNVEIPAGRFDLKISPKGLAVKEVKEEAGVKITQKDVKLINFGKSLALCSGILTEHMYLAYVEVTLEQVEKGERVFGVKAEGEEILRKFAHVSKLESMKFDNIIAWAMAQWFLKERYKKGRREKCIIHKSLY